MARKKDTFKYMTENVGLAGVEKLAGRNKCYSSVWFLLMLGGAGFCGYHLQDRISHFLSNPVVVDLRTENIPDPTFPVIHICSANIKNGVARTPCGTNFGVFAASSYNKHKVSSRNLSRTCNGIKGNLSDWPSALLPRVARPLREIVRYCTFDGRECKDEWFRPYISQTGICYLFNPEGELRSSLYGFYSNLKILLLDDSAPDGGLGSIVRGFSFSVSSPNQLALITTSPILVPTGMVSSIALKKRRSITLPYPYPSNCRNYELPQGSDNPSSKEGCIAHCTFNKIDQSLGCSSAKILNISLIQEDGLPACLLADFPDWLNVSHHRAIEFTRQCLPTCATPCNSIQYKSSMISQLAFHEDIEFASSSVAFVHMHLENAETEVVEQTPAYRWLAFMSDIGGAISLILGACLMTIVQLLDVLVWSIVSKFENRKNRVAKISIR